MQLSLHTIRQVSENTEVWFRCAGVNDSLSATGEAVSTAAAERCRAVAATFAVLRTQLLLALRGLALADRVVFVSPAAAPMPFPAFFARLPSVVAAPATAAAAGAASASEP